MAEAFRLSAAANVGGQIVDAINGLAAIGSNPLPSLHPRDLLAGIIGAAVVRLLLYIKSKDAKKFRKGVEYGSARWSA